MVKKKVKKRSSKKVSRKTSGSDLPLGIKVVSIVSYALAFTLLISSIILFVGGIAGQEAIEYLGVNEIVEYSRNANSLAAYATPFIFGNLILSGVVSFFVGAFYIYLGKSIWNKRNWARDITILLTGIGFISAFLGYLATKSPIEGVSIVVNGVVCGYMWFNKKVRKTFGV